MAETKTLHYADFSKGEYGELGEFRAPPGSYSGVNVVLYTNGMLGPRAGLHLNEPDTGSLGTGQIRGLWYIGRIGKPLMINVDDTVFSATENNFGLGDVATSATLDDVPVDFIRACWYDPNGQIYFSSPEQKTYALNWADDTLSEILVRNGGSESAGPQTLYLCRDRLYAAGDGYSGGPGGHRVTYSAAADFTNFGGGGFFDVGYFNHVRAIMESQNSLLFSTMESVNSIGNSVGWYSLVPAVPTGDLRRVNTQLGSEGQSEVVNADGGNFYFFTGWTTDESDTPYLVSSNGAKFDEDSFKHLRLAGKNRFGYYNATDKTLLYVSDEGNNGLMRVNGAWSKVNFEVPVSGPLCPTSRGDSFLLGYGETGQDVKIYELLSRPDKPGVAGGNANPGDDSNTPINAFFLLPAYQEEMKDVRVRRVVVDFMKWNTVHDDEDNEFTVAVKTYGQYNLPAGSEDGTHSVTQTWSENQTNADTNGTIDRYVARFGQQGWAAAFQIGILGMKGVAIESVTVEFDVMDATGRPI